MPTYLLQWEAMNWAAARGCKIYDLWGIRMLVRMCLKVNFPGAETVSGVFIASSADSGVVRRSVGAWDRASCAGYTGCTSWHRAGGEESSERVVEDLTFAEFDKRPDLE